MLSQLRLMRLRFALQVTTEASIPPYKGDLLRRALLWHLGSIWCREPERCRDGCQSPEKCLFGRLLEPPVNLVWSESIRRLMGSTPPPAFVLWDEQDRRRQLAASDEFHFELVLIGQSAMRQLSSFIAAVMMAGRQNIEREGLACELRRVDVLTGSQGELHPLFVDGTWLGPRAGPGHAPIANLTLSYSDGQVWAREIATPANKAVKQFRLRFLSPAKIKVRGKLVDRPYFAPLARALVRRLRILSEVHGAGEWPQTEYGPLLDLADKVQLEHQETAWLGASHSNQRRSQNLTEGFLGQAWYASATDLRPLLPILWLGQWLHVGKRATLGHGRYVLERCEHE